MNSTKTFRYLCAVALVWLIASPAAIADEISGVGFLDQAAVGSLPQFQRANVQVSQYRARLDSQFSAAMKGAHSNADRQRIASQFQQKFINEQRSVLGPLFARAQAAIAQVSSSQGLTVIVDKRIVVYGGTDITKNVVDLINGPGPVVAPAATPAPSVIGYVDQSQIDQVPKIKQANDAFTKYAAAQRDAALNQMKSAKNNPKQQQAIFQNYQKAVEAQQQKQLQPLVDATRNAMARVAAQKHLILVVDRADIIYGGTDITQDVQNALK
jgi:outer membrane protein